MQGAQAAIDQAAANVDVLKAQQQEAARTLNELQTAVAKAERDLSFTQIRAPIDGVFGNRAVHTGDFVRVRIGIGKPPGRQTGTDYVLKRPGKAERAELDVAVVEAADAVEAILADGPAVAMNRYNAPS